MPAKGKEYQHDWYLAHRESEIAKALVRMKVRYEEHGEEIRAYEKDYRVKNLDKLKTYDRERYPARRDDSLVRSRLWDVEHPGVVSARVREWQKANPEIVAEYRRKSKAKRRVLGFIPLNEPFDGCEGHHQDKEYVWYVPHWLHRSVYHNVWTGQGMEEINALVYQWLSGQERVGLAI